MHLEPDVMAQAVGIEGRAGSELVDLVRVTLEDSQLQKPLDGDLVGQDVEIVHLDAGLESRNTRLLHFLHDLVDRFGLLAGPGSGNGECAGHVAGVELVFASGVEANELSTLQWFVVFEVVEGACVLAAAGDDWICLFGCAVGDAGVGELTLDLSFVLEVPDVSQHGSMGFG